jgi:dihydroorotase
MKAKQYEGVKLYDSSSEFHLKLVDISIDSNGYALSASKKNEAEYEASPAWVEFLSNFCDPGYEHKETLESGMQLAQKNGFAAVGISPLNQPKTDSKAAIKYLLSENNKYTKALPLATLTCNAEGKDLTEILDLNHNGAVAFYDGKKGLSDKLLSKALLYSLRNDVLICMHPCNNTLNEGAVVNESLNGVLTGLKTSPSLSEFGAVRAALDVLEYTGGRLHFHLVSAKESVQLIREAQNKGLQVSCSAAFHHLLYTDVVNQQFDSHLKVWPPFRTEDDRQALIAGVKDGTIDIICADHQPVDLENKDCEYGLAEEGINGLPHMMPVLHKNFAHTNAWESILRAVSTNPAAILKTSVENSLNIWYTKGQTSILDSNNSLSENSPYVGMETNFELIESLRM